MSGYITECDALRGGYSDVVEFGPIWGSQVSPPAYIYIYIYIPDPASRSEICCMAPCSPCTEHPQPSYFLAAFLKTHPDTKDSKTPPKQCPEEVVLFLTLERLKRGTKTKSSACIYIYIYMAKASFSAYVLVKNLRKTREKVHFSTKKHDQFWSSFLFLPFSLFCLKMARICCFCLAKSQKRRQKTRPPPYIYML